MSELTLVLLRIAFLVLMWVFVFAIVYALRSDLFGARVRKLDPAATPTAPATERPPPSANAPTEAVGRQTRARGPATRLVITSGARAGTELVLGDEPLTIGRSAESGLVIRDEYTSTHHARLMLWDGDWMIQDLDSTNGTYLDGRRVTQPTPVPVNTPVRIGTTSFELRS